MSHMRIGAKTFIQVVGSFALVLCAVEMLARVGSTLVSDLEQLRSQKSYEPTAWFRYSPVMGWENRPGFKGKSDDQIDREFDAQGVLKLNSNEERASHPVLFLGDSNTFGYGVPTGNGFPEVIERLLPGVKTMNLGVVGYTSYQGRKTLEKYLAQIHPAAVVASFNFNDRRGVAAGEEDGPVHFQKVYDSSRNPIRSLNGDFGFLYFYRGLGAIMQRVKLLSAKDLHHEPVDKLRPRVDELHYRENLTAIISLTRRAGVPLVFVLLRDNPLQSGYLKHGIERQANGDYEAAIEDFGVPILANGMHADLARMYQARAYRAMGNNKESAAVLREGERVVWMLGGRPIRPDWEYNNIMQELAREYNIDLVDAASLLEKDPYVYIDFCHFDSAGHRKVAELLATHLAEALKPAPGGMPAKRGGRDDLADGRSTMPRNPGAK
jgi:lysophospholipase L1-like esterase